MSPFEPSQLLDALDVGIIVLDERAFIVGWNDWIARAAARSKQSVLGKSLYEVFPDLRETRLPAVIEDSLRAGSSSLLTHSLNKLLPLRGESGQEVLHNVVVRPFPAGDTNHCILQINDVTASVTRERVLRQRQNARYHAIVDSAPDAIITMSLDGTIQWVNVAAEKVFGYTPAELLNKKIDILFERVEDLSSIFALREPDFKEFKSMIEAVGRRKSGSPGHFDVSFARWTADGRVFVTTIWRDVTERKRVEQDLRESEARYRAALTAGRMGHWEVDIAAATRTWSDEGMALFGFNVPGGRGHLGGEADELRRVMHPDDRHLVRKFLELADTQESFPTEYRIVRPDGAMRWLSGRGHVVARSADGKALRVVNVMADVTDRKVAEDHIRFLMREISHRSKNLLSVVQAIASQTGRSVGSVEEFQARFSRRLQGLAASHDLLVHQDWQGATLGDLVRDQLAPFVEAGGARTDVSGPAIFVSPEAAESLGLALHELATNAVKYGALSVPTGHVTVSWGLENESTTQSLFRLSWLERGGPAVTPPSRKGFGHIVFERLITKTLGGRVAMNFMPEGLRWELSTPRANLVSSKDSQKPAGL